MAHLTLEELHIRAGFDGYGRIRVPETVRGETLHILQVCMLNGGMPDGPSPVVIVDMTALDRTKHVGGVRLAFDLLHERFD